MSRWGFRSGMNESPLVATAQCSPAKNSAMTTANLTSNQCATKVSYQLSAISSQPEKMGGFRLSVCPDVTWFGAMLLFHVWLTADC